MATTTNFGWATPDDTDFVKDGAAAIRTLGSSIDTSLVDLKGGATGQVLSKTSATDMDFTWVTTDDANAIQNSIVDAKGDLISATANDTPARLAVGANGETLVADSSTSTGLRWQVPVNPNLALNSSMQIWQRGTSFAVNPATYTADRWQALRGVAGLTVTRQTTSDTTNLPFIQYCARVARDSGNTSTAAIYYAQSFESVNSIPFAGKTITLSFYARRGANFSSTSNIMSASVVSGTGTDQNVYAGLTGQASVITQNATLTTTWQRFSFTGTVATTATQLAVYFNNSPVGTAGAADYFEITGVQIEAGSVATPFQTATGTIQGELAACQRYYYRVGTAVANAAIAAGISSGAADASFAVFSPVPMRVPPTSIDAANLATTDYTSFTNAITAPGSFARSSVTSVQMNFTGGSGMTAFRPVFLVTNNVSGYLGISAEL
jgi:hypothetical protein